MPGSLTWKIVLAIGAKVFGYLIKQMTPVIKEALEKAMLDLYQKALITENPFDDHVMAMILEVLDLKKPGVELSEV